MVNCKLGVCIIQLPFLMGDIKRTQASVESLPCSTKIYTVSSFIDAQRHLLHVKEDWTLLLYSYETLDSCYFDSIEIMLNENSIDAYRFMCVRKTISNPTVIENVRLLRKGVTLLDRQFEVLPDSKVTRILDGWILEHGTENEIHSISEIATIS